MANVLLIEPNAALARTYMQALQHVEHQVVCVGNAQDAIAAADEATPDVVLLELQLAGHDGVEFLHEFRSYPEWEAIPVIANTGLDPHVLAPLQWALAQDLGVAQTLYKPRTTLEQLLSAVNAQLGGA